MRAQQNAFVRLAAARRRTPRRISMHNQSPRPRGIYHQTAVELTCLPVLDPRDRPSCTFSSPLNPPCGMCASPRAGANNQIPECLVIAL